ncbi:hypothetical protein XENTR_v10011857 [Xenopus tropicalis]|nr:hypothetical protein XENTR_v10011857 [Xenopus tropicalis]
MTLEEQLSGDQSIGKMESVGNALEEVLCKAKLQRTITIGVYEAAKLLNVDPDNVVLCLLATDDTYDQDIALQIHFTLIQAFCCENDINILRVSNMSRLAEILGGSDKPGEPADLHCILINVGNTLMWSLPGGAWVGSAVCIPRQ